MSFMPARDVGVAALANDDGIGVPLADLAAKYTYAWFAEGPDAAAATDVVESNAVLSDRTTSPGAVVPTAVSFTPAPVIIAPELLRALEAIEPV